MQAAKKLVHKLIPPLTTDWRKGQHGRVGVVGGSFEYTGAPYYAGISSLKTGADLCYLFCTEEAAIPIKSYSPELIVHPLLRSDNSLKNLPEGERKSALEIAVERISDVFPRLDALVIGPGLGRDAAVQEITRQLIQRARTADLPLILDGDALFLMSLEPEIIRGYDNAILTPNAMEYARLCVSIGLLDEADPAQAAAIPPAELSKALGPAVIQKGRVDAFSDGENTFHNDEFGCPRRCGGQGDVLTGAIATFVAWSKHRQISSDQFSGNPLLLAALGGSLVTRASALEAFAIHQRSMTAPDVLHNVGKGMGDDNREELIAENEKELAGFASGASSTITPVLERVLEDIRVTGVPRYSWAHLKKLLVAKLQIAMDQVAAADTTATMVGMGWSPTNKNKSSERRSNITELLNTFEGPPFTLQRLTEVILEPQKSYKTLNKLINALEKLLAVSTTIQVADPRAPAGASPNVAEENVMQAPLSVQVVHGNTEGDVVARAPWGSAEASS